MVDGDTAILRLVRDRPPGQRDQALVVTDDRLLADHVRAAGAHRRNVAWLVGQLAPAVSSGGGIVRASSTSRPVGLGHGRPPASPERQRRDPDSKPWTPGRGATRKRGNPKRTGR
jgi:hypothetical protein